MAIVISGASGHLARLISEELVRAVPASDLILVTRTPEALADWAARGARVVHGDHRSAESLRLAYQGGDRLMLISGLAIGKRVAEHANAIEAAKAAGIAHITYTSVAGPHPRNPTPSAADHVGTERLLWASGLGFAALRNQMYAELLYDMVVDTALPTGRWLHVGDTGRIAPVSRSDIAASATAILLAPDQHDRVTYELTGPERFSFRQIAALASKLFRQPIDYTPVSADALYAELDAAGLPRKGLPDSDIIPVRFGSDELVQSFVAYDQGYHDILSSHVEYLTGRKPKSLADVLAGEIARRFQTSGH
jgi:NAD(P)H dehydrogenase (quinone)